MQVSKEQINSAREGNLANFFIQNGYKCEQHGSELHVRGFGGLYVNTNENSWYQFSEQRGDRNPVNCLTEVLGMDFTTAVNSLSSVSYEKSVSNPTQNYNKPLANEETPSIIVRGSNTTGFDVTSVGFEIGKKYSVTEFNAALAKANDLWLNSDRNDGHVGHDDSVIISIENVDKQPCSFKFNLTDEYHSVQQIVDINPMPYNAEVTRNSIIEKLNKVETQSLETTEKKETSKSKSNYPDLYKKSFAYAQEHGETEQFMASHTLNMECTADISRSVPLSTSFATYTLDYQRFLGEISEKYGAERAAFVLSANVIQRKNNASPYSGMSYDFSEEANKATKQFEFPEKKYMDCYILGSVLGGIDDKTVDKMLCDFNKITQEKTKNTELELPINEHEKKRIFAYLVKERQIDPKLVQELVDKKLLYQGSIKYKDKDGNEALAKGNAVFIQKDVNGKVVGAEIHGTNTYKRFKKIEGSGDENLFQYPIGTPKKVYAFESTIDLLSFKMLANPEKIQDSLLVSMGGLKPTALKKLEESGLKIYSCVDNDEKGKKFNETNGFQSANKKLSEEGCKDWNELLQKRVRELSKKIETPAEKTERKPTHKSSPKR